MTTQAEHHHLQCPNCGHEMLHLVDGDVDYDGCRNCFGLFISGDDLKKLLARSPRDLSDKTSLYARDSTFIEIKVYDPDRHCPICGSSTRRYQYCFNSGINIDGCPNGHGVYLDLGELEKISRFYNSGKSEISPSDQKLIRRNENKLEDFIRYNFAAETSEHLPNTTILPFSNFLQHLKDFLFSTDE